MVQKLKFDQLRKKILGITGSFGSGKSEVSRMLGQLGAHVIDADELAHEALKKGSPVYAKIAALFKGADIEGVDRFDRKKIAQIVFQDSKRKKALEDLIHPYVFERILDEGALSKTEVLAVEVPLLFETGFNQYCYKTLVVEASQEVIDKRLKKKGFSQSQIQARRNAQMPLEEKTKRADIIINNAGTIEETRKKVNELWKKLHL